MSGTLAEMLSTELGGGGQLRSVPGENIARMKLDLSLPDAESYAPDTLARIRKHSGTDLVVLGSYVAMGNDAGNRIRIRADHVIEAMIEGLGGHAERIDAPFDPEAGAYAEGHHHHHHGHDDDC